MFPIVDDHVRDRNPDFAKLYQQLTTDVLNPDASTKNHPEAKDRAAVDKILDEHRIKAIKQHLLERAIATATPDSNHSLSTTPSSSSFSSSSKPSRPGRFRHTQPLPPPSPSPSPSPSSTPLSEPLLDLLTLLPPLLSTPTTPHPSLSLLLSQPPLADLPTHLPRLADLVSSTLHRSALGLARLTHPTTSHNFLHRHVSSLPQDLKDIKDRLASAERALSAARRRALAALADLLQSYAQCLTGLIRSLEAKHGVIARSLELRATDISLQAQIAEKQSEVTLWRLRKQVYVPDVVSALHTYANHLRDAKMRAAEKVSGLEAELRRYGVQDGPAQGGQEVREMARYRGVGQMDDVERDMQRLHFS